MTFKDGHAFTVKIYEEEFMPGTWLVPFISDSQRKCSLIKSIWMAGTEPCSGGGSQASPFYRWKHWGAETGVSKLTVPWTSGLRHIVRHWVTSALQCPWPLARITLQHLLKSGHGVLCRVDQTFSGLWSCRLKWSAERSARRQQHI